MAFLPFVLASLAGRGARFFLVTALIVWGGERMEHTIKKYVDWLGWGIGDRIIGALAWHQFY